MQIIDLPPLPTNARYVLHNNECYDWGTFGWALTTQGINVDKYSYFIFMNSSVRGPFVPTYIKVQPFEPALHLICVLSRAQWFELETDTLTHYEP